MPNPLMPDHVRNLFFGGDATVTAISAYMATKPGQGNSLGILKVNRKQQNKVFANMVSADTLKALRV